MNVLLGKVAAGAISNCNYYVKIDSKDTVVNSIIPQARMKRHMKNEQTKIG